MRSTVLFRMYLIGGVCLMALGAAMPLAAATPASAPAAEPTPSVPGNLLVNPGFENPYGKQCCQTDLSIYLPLTPIDEVQVPQGWFAWWRTPDSSPAYPSRCDLPIAPRICQAWHRPEWREAAPFANRIRSGSNAQKYFTFMSVHEAGMYQRVTGVKPGQKLQFSVYMMAWSTNEAENTASTGQQTMNLKVGIDPFGGTDPFSPNIVWSKAGDSYDVFSQFTVQATAGSSAVTAFTYSQPVYPLHHNDVYVDDAALVVVGAGNVPVSFFGGSSASSSSSSSASTVVAGPFPGTTLDKQTGNILYVVAPGDSLYELSVRFNTTVKLLVSWNNLKNADSIRIGRTIIVGKTKK